MSAVVATDVPVLLPRKYRGAIRSRQAGRGQNRGRDRRDRTGESPLFCAFLAIGSAGRRGLAVAAGPRMKTTLLFTTIAGLALVTRIASADGTPPPDEIARRSLAHPLFALEGAEVHATMTLASGGGGTAEKRAFLVQSKKVGGLLRSVTRFAAPQTVAGTAFLSIQNADRADDQYVFLPRLKSTRRVGTGVDRDASFMGSDLTYDDLTRKSGRDAAYKALPDETLDGEPCFKIEATPKVPGRIARSVTWVRKSDFAPIRTDTFEANNVPSKTLRITKTQTFGDRRVASEVSAEDLKTHHKTTVTIDTVKFDAHFGDGDFTPNALAR
jgi:hypothetical protein